MANFFVRNSLNPDMVVRFGITYSQLIPKGYEGEALWLIEIKTNELDTNGNIIPPEYINAVSLDNLDSEIENAISIMAAKIDWQPLLSDTKGPYVSYCSPSEGPLVPIETDINIIIKDNLPSSGIDIDSIRFTINDQDVTEELSITGDPYEYKLKWAPKLRLLDTYE